MNQDQIAEAETWVVFWFSGRGTKKKTATSQYLEEEKKEIGKQRYISLTRKQLYKSSHFLHFSKMFKEN